MTVEPRGKRVGSARLPVLLALLGAVAVPCSGFAQGRAPDLAQLSIEDLMNVEITSAARKEQRAGDAAAAVFVITHDDIRRSGTTTIRDLLRPAPGVDVAQINADKSAVSVRGFNGLRAKKLLVLVDGRSVYSRIFSGVLWDAEDMILDDIDRIEGWTHTRAGGASLQIQSFVDIAGRQEPIGDYHRRAVDVDAQYHTALGAHQDLVAGAGYRFIDEKFAGRVGFSLTPAEGDSSLLTAFLQDEIGLFEDRLAVTLGSQVQYDSESGAGVEPTARVMWKALPRQRLWAATSRALRTPSLLERGIRVEFPPVPSASGLPLVVSLRGNPAAATETFVDAEAGYRLEQLEVDAYTRADISAEWRFTRRLSAMAIGNNLFDAAHAEFAGPSSLLLTTQAARSASLRLRRTFR